jgi:hypothetical protein
MLDRPDPGDVMPISGITRRERVMLGVFFALAIFIAAYAFEQIIPAAPLILRIGLSFAIFLTVMVGAVGGLVRWRLEWGILQRLLGRRNRQQILVMMVVINSLVAFVLWLVFRYFAP